MDEAAIKTKAQHLVLVWMDEDVPERIRVTAKVLTQLYDAGWDEAIEAAATIIYDKGQGPSVPLESLERAIRRLRKAKP